MEQLLLSPGDVEDVGDDLNVAIDPRRIEETVEKAVQRLPMLERARIAGGWAGLRPLTPDDHAIIGWAPGVEGFFLAVGFAGHGFQHSPTTGRVVAEWLTDGKPSIDCSLFDPARFAAGPARPHAGGPRNGPPDPPTFGAARETRPAPLPRVPDIAGPTLIPRRDP